MNKAIPLHLENLDKRLFLIRIIFLFIGLGISVIYAKHQIITGDHLQMLHKGYLGAYQDTWLAFGNAASAVGNVPGSLSAWIVGGPLLIWDNPWSPMLFLIALRLIGYFLLDNIIKQVFSPQVRLLFVVLYWLNPWFLYENQIYNPSYLFLFSALFLWSSFKLKDNPNFIISVLHVLAIGGAMQFHYSWPVLMMISLLLQYKKFITVSKLGILVGIGIILISLIPYFQEYAVNTEIKRETDRYIGYGAVHVYPVLKSVLYWLRYGSLLFSNYAVLGTNFDWLTSITWLQNFFKYSWQVVIYAIGVLSLYFSIKINWRSLKEIKPILKNQQQLENNQQWLLVFSFAAVISIIINAMLSPITFSYWHLIITFPFALFPMLVYAERLRIKNIKKFNFILLLIIGFFIFVNLIIANDSKKYSYKVDYTQQIQQYLSENEDFK